MKPYTMLLAACSGSMWSLAHAAEDPDEDCAPGRCPGDSGGGIDYNPPGWPPAVPGDQYAWYATNWQTGLSHGNPTAPVSGWYNFNLSAPAVVFTLPYYPGFDCHCNGTATGSPLESKWEHCNCWKGFDVRARIWPSNDSTEAHVAIWYQADHLNVTAFVVKEWARERPPYNFTIDDFSIYNS
ncbi:hypothetical protein E8E14_006973 [Neopestalotiopsis sp. 37M]|nr:hypothetical protein E8E14_006973 [Neopestalotiopsis sp. 37M]